MSNFLRIAALTLLGCALPTLAVNAVSAPFDIQHDTAYARMALPSTLGESAAIDWGLQDFGMWLGLESGPLEVVSIFGTAQTGPLLSLDAELDPDGSLGQADYVFGKGAFELELVIRLLDGTLHTMQIRGATGPMEMSATDFGGSFYMGVRKAKIDKASSELFGIGRQLTGEMPYYVDVVPDPNDPDVRLVALFGIISFDDRPAPGLNAVPEPATLGLVAAGVAGLALRASSRRRRR